MEEWPLFLVGKRGLHTLCPFSYPVPKSHCGATKVSAQLRAGPPHAPLSALPSASWLWPLSPLAFRLADSLWGSFPGASPPLIHMQARPSLPTFMIFPSRDIVGPELCMKSYPAQQTPPPGLSALLSASPGEQITESSLTHLGGR